MQTSGFMDKSNYMAKVKSCYVGKWISVFTFEVEQK